MNHMQDERHVVLAAAGLSAISQEFADEMERRPSSRELFEILTWGLRSCPDDVLLDVQPRAIIALTPKVKRRVKRSGSGANTDEAESAVGDLNDDVFVV